MADHHAWELALVHRCRSATNADFGTSWAARLLIGLMLKWHPSHARLRQVPDPGSAGEPPLPPAGTCGAL
jgi:hypothetical protein